MSTQRNALKYSGKREIKNVFIYLVLADFISAFFFFFFLRKLEREKNVRLFRDKLPQQVWSLYISAFTMQP